MLLPGHDATSAWALKVHLQHGIGSYSTLLCLVEVIRLWVSE